MDVESAPCEVTETTLDLFELVTVAVVDICNVGSINPIDPAGVIYVGCGLFVGTGHRAQDTGHEQRGFVLEGLMKDWVRCVGVWVWVWGRGEGKAEANV